MFPAQLATGPFSLREGERSCAVSISAELSPEGELTAHSVVASRVTPTHRMTYDQVDAAIASSDPEQLTPDLRALLEVHPPCSLPSGSLPCSHRCNYVSRPAAHRTLRRSSMVQCTSIQWGAGNSKDRFCLGATEKNGCRRARHGRLGERSRARPT